MVSVGGSPFSHAGIEVPKYLLQQRRVWYAVLDIPKALRPRFGKARFKETLQTESLTVAQRRVHTKIAQWKTLIEVVRSGADELEVRKAELRIMAEEHRREGMSEEDIKDLSADIAATLRNEDKMIVEVHNSTLGSWITLSEHIDSWIASSDSAPKTKDMKKSDAQRFAKKFKYAHDATKKKLVQWVEIELMEEGKLTAATCRRIISACRSYWRWLERHKDLDLPLPFDGVVPKAGTKAAKAAKAAKAPKRKPFSTTDFHSLIENVPDSDKALRNLIKLGGYTGARIEELCSLKLTNVTHDRLIIQDAKTDAGTREIPIHKDIAGLVAKLIKDSRDGYLLSGLSTNKYDDRSNAIGKRFGRLKSRLGYGTDHVFHSLRKMFATQLENAGLPENVASRLLGHELGTMSYGLYSGGIKFEVLSDAINQITYTSGQIGPESARAAP